MVNNETKSVPKSSLAFLFPGGFNEFWAKTEIKKDLEQIIYEYIPATDTKEELKKTLASGGYGLLARPIAKHYFDRYQFRTYEPHEDVFVSTFKTNVISIIIEIRRKEYLWQKIYREVDKLAKETTRRETQINKGGLDKSNRNKQTTATNTKQTILSREITDRENKTDNYNLSGWDQKGTTQLTIDRKHNDLIAVSRLINNFLLTVIKLSDYYPLFDKLFIKFFGATVVPIIDEKTGRRKWISEAEYEELETEETPKPKLDAGNEWDETLPYLERLKILLAKTEKEYSKLPDTSNRKPRVALRLQINEGAVKAYSKEDLNLPTAEEFRKRVSGEVEGFQKVIGYEDILKMVETWLEGWDFYKEYGGDKPEQLMIALSGPPGLGKSYISQCLAKALNRGFHIISMNGKQSASIVYGTDISNPGAEPGEIVKAISKREDRACVVFFDELEKAGKDAKRAVGNPTDRTVNKDFKDDFFDFPTPLNEIIYLVAINYPEDLPDFIRDRFRVIDVLPLPYSERLEVVRLVLRGKFKPLDNAFRKIYGKGWEEMYSLFDNEELLKKTLTRTFSIRGAKDNIILSLIPTLIANFLKRKKGLPSDLVSYDWKFIKKEELDKGDKDRGRPACPYSANRENKHREGCECFMANLEKVPGWRERMEE
jgi:hypothetical protein